ncbi:hypothetical protein QOT17_022438 [Balamuthia mandrillaris]
MTTFCPKCKRKTADVGPAVTKTAANGRKYQLMKCGSCGATRQLVSQYGNIPIIAMFVVRSLIQRAITTLGNILTMGQLDKTRQKLQYDDLYHLYLVLQLQSGHVIRLEKNQVVSAKLASNADLQPRNRGALQIQLVGEPLLATLLDNTLKAVGKQRMWLYSADRYNCQLFIHDILAANGMLTEELKQFIVQDAAQLLKAHPRIRGLAKLATDLAAKIDYVVYGAGLRLD